MKKLKIVIMTLLVFLMTGCQSKQTNEVQKILVATDGDTKPYTYYDEIQKIYATFATFDDNLIWLILNE